MGRPETDLRAVRILSMVSLTGSAELASMEMERPPSKVVDSRRLTPSRPLSWASMGLVRSSSTSRAEALGQDALTVIQLYSVSGHTRRRSWVRPKAPAAITRRMIQLVIIP